MPYFWENIKWKKRLSQLKIPQPKESGFELKNVVGPSYGMESITEIFMENFRNKLLNESVHFEILHKFLDIKTDKQECLIAPLAEMLNLTDGESIVEQMLSTPGIGRVKINSEIRYQQKLIEHFLENISTTLKLTRDEFGFSLCQIGSMAEECKTGYADEYDYRLDLRIDDEKIQKCIQGDFPLGDIDNEIQNGSLMFLTSFYALLEKTLGSYQERKSDNPLEMCSYGFNDTGIIYILFNWEKKMLIKVDCVPAIQINGYWPCELKYDPLGNSISQICHIILRYGPEKKIVPSWSVCDAEVNFMKTLPEYLKESYVLAKIIWGSSLLGTSGTLSVFLAINVPTSYNLKNSLYHCLSTKICDAIQKTSHTESVLAACKMILQNISHEDSRCFFLSSKVICPNVFKVNAICLKIWSQLYHQHFGRQSIEYNHDDKQHDELNDIVIHSESICQSFREILDSFSMKSLNHQQETIQNEIKLINVMSVFPEIMCALFKNDLPDGNIIESFIMGAKHVGKCLVKYKETEMQKTTMYDEIGLD